MRAASLILLVLSLSGCAHLQQNDLLELQSRADQAYSAADYANASSLYGQLAKAMPTDAEVRYQQGNSLARLGDHSQAIISYRDALQRDPLHARAWHNLLQVQIQESRITATEIQRYLNTQTPHAERALKRAENVLEAFP